MKCLKKTFVSFSSFNKFCFLRYQIFITLLVKWPSLKTSSPSFLDFWWSAHFQLSLFRIEMFSVRCSTYLLYMHVSGIHISSLSTCKDVMFW